MHKSLFTNILSISASFAILCSSSLTVHAFSSDTFVPRLTEPKNNPDSQEYAYYYSNDNIFQKINYGMPNCTAYAWGRSLELLGAKPLLSNGNAGRWYTYNISQGNYAYGSQPKLGAVACWDLNDNINGHVAVVEQISADRNIITTSESQWGKLNFAVYTFKGDSSDHMSRYRFLGYIYIDDASGRHYGDAFKLRAAQNDKLLTYSENLALDLNITLNNTAIQNFRFEPVGEDSYKIWSISDDLLLYQSDNSVNLSADDNSQNTLWKIYNEPDGKFSICTDSDTNKVLTVGDGLRLTNYSSALSQMWNLERITGVTPLCSSKRPTKPVEIKPNPSPEIQAPPTKPSEEYMTVPDHSGFTIDYSGARTDYAVGDIVDLTNIIFKIDNIAIDNIDISKLSPVYDFSYSGSSTVTINYGEYSASYPVNIADISGNSSSDVESADENLITESDNIVLISSISQYIVSDEVINDHEYDVNKDQKVNIIDIMALING